MVMTQNKVILKFMESLADTDKTGTAALDQAVKRLGYTSFQELRQSFCKDIKPYQASSKSKELEFLEDYCSIHLSNADTGAITGSDAGGAETKTAESVVPEATAVRALKTKEYNSFEWNGLTVNVTYAKAQYGFPSDQATLEAKERLVVKNLYNWWIKDSLDLIEKSLGINFFDGRASVTELEVKFDAPNSGYKYYKPVRLNVNSDSWGASKLTLTIDMNYFMSLSGSDKNGKINRYGEVEYLDRDFLDALTEATLAANVKGFTKLPNYLKLGLISLVGGGDSSYNKYFGVKCSSGGLSGDYWDSSFEAYAVLRYMARQVSDKSLPKGLSVSKDGLTITASTAFKGAFNASDYSEAVKTIDVKKANKSVIIKGNSKANAIYAGSAGGTYYGQGGNDTLFGGKGNDTLYGGEGKDVFVYAKGGGKDTISDFNPEEDVIRLISGESLIKSVVSGANAVLTIGSSGSITVKNGAGKSIIVKEEDGGTKKVFALPKGVTSNSKHTELTVKNPFEGKLDISGYESTIRNIDASKNSNELTLKGNQYNNTIKAGKAGGNYYGMKGNDTLQGGAGKDIYWYGKGEGKDTIKNFQSGKDVMRFYNKAQISSVVTSNTDVTLKSGDGWVKLTGMANKRVDVIGADGKSAVYYFGRQDKANTFVYAANRRYYGSAKKEDTLQISAAATVSLANTALYHDIDVLDATKSNGVVKLTGGSKKSVLRGGTKDDILTAGSGGGSLIGGAGNDKLYGGKGVDKFYWGSRLGNDTIYNYISGKDVVVLSAGKIKSGKISGKDVILTSNTGNTLTLNKVAGKEITILDKDGNQVNLTKWQKSENIISDTNNAECNKAAIPLQGVAYYPEEAWGEASEESSCIWSVDACQVLVADEDDMTMDSASLYFDDAASYLDADSMKLESVSLSQDSLTARRAAEDLAALSGEMSAGGSGMLLAGTPMSTDVTAPFGENGTASSTVLKNSESRTRK